MLLQPEAKRIDWRQEGDALDIVMSPQQELPEPSPTPEPLPTPMPIPDPSPHPPPTDPFPPSVPGTARR
jgi:hypothetical protein